VTALHAAGFATFTSPHRRAARALKRAAFTLGSAGALAATATLAAWTAAAAPPPMFDAPFMTFNSGPGPQTAAGVDLDEDGFPDIVVNGAEVLTNNRDRTFLHRVPFPKAGVLGDLNGDGRPDLVAGGTGVTVFLNLGAGVFGPGVVYGGGTTYVVIGVADVNGDGRADVVAIASSSLAVLTGNGDGTLGAVVTSSFGAGVAFALGDFNRDGRSDVVSVQGRGLSMHPCWTVMPGNADGTLGPAQTHGICGIGHFSDVAVGDLDGDGFLDIAMVPGIEVDFGDGAGGFPRTSSFASAGGTAVAIADADGDGRNDLLTANDADRSVSVLFGLGGGALEPHVDIPVGREPQDVAVSDFDRDGRPDLVAATSGCTTVSDMRQCDGSSQPAVPTVSVLFGREGRAFGGVGITVGRSGVQSTTLADLDGDGLADLVTLNNDNMVSVMRSVGNGAFDPRVDYSMGSGTGKVRLADLDRDGRLDLIVPTSGSNAVTVRLGTGGTTFGAAQDFPAGNSPSFLAVGDLNGDGRLDVAVASRGANSVSILLGSGSGSFGPPSTFPLPSSGAQPTAIALGDVDGDGRLDLAVSNDFVGTDFCRGNGNGTFGPVTVIPPSRTTADVALADLNGDGRADLVTANYGFGPNPGETTVTVNLSTGGGMFGPPVFWDTGFRSNTVVVVDLDADGTPDLVTSDEANNSTSILRGNGNGTFREKIGFGSTGQRPAGLSVGDVNGDGALDLAMANKNSGTVTVLLRTVEHPTPTLLQSFSAAPTDHGIELRWRLSDPAQVSDLVLERSMGPAWTPVAGTPRLEDQSFVLVDRDAAPGRESIYRLRGLVAGVVRVLGTVHVRTAPITAALLPVVPSPARREVRLAYTLAHAADVRLSICDVQGREVAVIDRGTRSAGVHQTSWSGRIAEHDASAGIYFVRLDTDGLRLTRRWVLAP
jgi:hypothetical protein